MAGATNTANTVADPLANLRDIHLPDAIGYWPLAPGWWLLMASMVVLAVIMFLAVRHYRRNAYRREAIRQLSNIHQQYLTASQGSARNNAGRVYLQQINRLLKQVYFTRDVNRVAGLNGQSWIEELQRAAPKVRLSRFSDRLLALYTPDLRVEDSDVAEIQQEMRQWLRQHKAGLLIVSASGEGAHV